MLIAGLFAVSCGGGASGSSSASSSGSMTSAGSLSYPIVATGQKETFDNYREIPFPKEGEAFYGQDAQFITNPISYTDNGDDTITDNVTGLMWQKGFVVMGYYEALAELERLNKEDKYSDWRLPTMKQLYSIMNFNGFDISGIRDADTIPFIDKNYFDFKYGANGNRPIDTQLLSSSIYTSTTMGGAETVFGLNVADGRIKGYPLKLGDGEKLYTVRFVRGDNAYGVNKFVDNKDNTITDEATGLMQAKDDNQSSISWEEAFAYVQKLNDEKYLGYSDWRLPNAKELHSILDYSRSPKKTSSAAIDPIFNTTEITVEDGSKDYGYYWTSTTHKNTSADNGTAAVYICFGEGMGFLPVREQGMSPNEIEGMGHSSGTADDTYYLTDVHGAGSQRSDFKVGDPADYPNGHGPQGDTIRIYNLVRPVRTFS